MRQFLRRLLFGPRLQRSSTVVDFVMETGGGGEDRRMLQESLFAAGSSAPISTNASAFALTDVVAMPARQRKEKPKEETRKDQKFKWKRETTPPVQSTKKACPCVNQDVVTAPVDNAPSSPVPTTTITPITVPQSENVHLLLIPQKSLVRKGPPNKSIMLKLSNMQSLKEENKDTICPILLEPFDEGRVEFLPEDACVVKARPDLCVGTLPCGHQFHALSIIAHMALSSMRCPICRYVRKKTPCLLI